MTYCQCTEVKLSGEFFFFSTAANFDAERSATTVSYNQSIYFFVKNWWSADASGCYLLNCIEHYEIHRFAVADSQSTLLTNCYISQALQFFFDTLISIGEMWTGNDEWMVKCREDSFSKLDNLEHYGMSYDLLQHQIDMLSICYPSLGCKVR